VKITCKNFKQHEDREFLFPDKGLVLLNGGSGRGKSTIFKAILEALYDSVKKPYTFGTKVCSVDLELGDLKIMRQKGPNRLIVNGQEDAAAQDIIHKIMGMNEAEFMASSYIQQKMQSSLLTLSPADQLSFIEKLAFGENSPEKFKVKINDLVLARKKDVEGISKKTTMLDEMILPQEALIAKLESQLVETEEISQDIIKDTRERYSNFKQRKETALDVLRALTNEKNNAGYAVLDNLEKAQKHVESLQSSEAERLAALDVEVEKLGISWKEMSRTSAVEILEQWREYPRYCKVINELERHIIRLAEYNAQNDLAKADIETELNALPKTELSELKVLLKKITEINEWLNKKEELLAISNPISEKYLLAWRPMDLKGVKKFEAIKAEIEIVIEKTILAVRVLEIENANVQEKLSLLTQSEKQLICPQCQSALSLIEGKLKVEIATRDNENEKRELQQAIKDITTRISGAKDDLLEKRIDLNTVNQVIKDVSKFPAKPNELPAIKGQTAPIEEEIAAQTAIEQQRSNLLNKLELINKEQLSKRIEEEIELKFKEQQSFLKTWPNFENGIGFSKDVAEQKAEVKRLEEYLVVNDDKDTQRRNLNLQKVNESALLNNAKQALCDLESKANSVRSALRHKHLIDAEISSNETEITNAVAKMAELTPVIEKLDLIAKQKQLNRDIDFKIESAKSNLQNLIDQKNLVLSETKIAEDKLEGTIRLKQFSEAAQMESIASVVESINIAAKDFLDLLFPDNPIIVSLLPFKQTKDAGVRAKFSTVIKYKGCEYSDIDEISGGEYDRIVLAYQLALNQIYQSPILLLDEAFTAVEEELFLLAMDALKIIAENKLIVVVSHGAIQGLFDEVIEV